MRVSAIGVIPNIAKESAREVAVGVIDWVRRKGFNVAMEAGDAAALGFKDAVSISSLQQDDPVVVLGGDGTTLRAVRLLGWEQRPLIVANLGTVGFISLIEPPALLGVLESYIESRTILEERRLLSVIIDGETYVYPVLNEVVVQRDPRTPLFRFDAIVNGVTVLDVAADGICVSTPTGSTAYASSCGAPVLLVGTDAFVVTAICPFMSQYRSVVAPSDAVVSIRTDGGGWIIVADGIPVTEGEGIVAVDVTMSQARARFVRQSPTETLEAYGRRLCGGRPDAS